MDIIKNLPWYDDYMLILEGRRCAEECIEKLKNPEKQLQRVKKFYENLGADYSKNDWIAQKDKDVSMTNKGEDSILSQYKRDVKAGNIVENAVQKQDDESIRALLMYKNDNRYGPFVGKIMFYIGVSKAKNEPDFIKKAYEGIYRRYPIEDAVPFIKEGVYYYIYYFQCLQILLKEHEGDDIKHAVFDRCYNARLMFNSYASNPFLEDLIPLVLNEIDAIETMFNEAEES
jgi:hypothetical protein